MAYPDAKVIGVEDTIKRMSEKSFPFDGRGCFSGYCERGEVNLY